VADVPGVKAPVDADGMQLASVAVHVTEIAVQIPAVSGPQIVANIPAVSPQIAPFAGRRAAVEAEVSGVLAEIPSVGPHVVRPQDGGAGKTEETGQGEAQRGGFHELGPF
jgi:hypothetical protein